MEEEEGRGAEGEDEARYGDQIIFAYIMGLPSRGNSQLRRASQ